MDERIKKKQLAILRVLKKAEKPLSSNKITDELANLGLEISERSVRLYLQQLDQDGFTLNFGRRGRQISKAGLCELDASGIMERVGFLSAKIDQMTYRMNFDLDNRSGTVVINFTLVKPDDLLSCAEKIKQVFAQGYTMGKFLALLPAGKHLGEITVPQGLVGIGTVCSITLNGVLLQHGIPTTSRFGGLLELQNNKPNRFVEIIWERSKPAMGGLAPVFANTPLEAGIWLKNSQCNWIKQDLAVSCVLADLDYHYLRSR